MSAVIRALHAGGGGTARLFAFGAISALFALLAGALLSLAPAAADEHLDYLDKMPADIELLLSLSNDPDNIVQAGEEFTVQVALRYTASRSEPPFDPYTRWIIPQGSDSELRISGGLFWDEYSSSRARPAAQSDFNAVGFQSFQAPNGNLMAFDDRTIVVRGGITRPTLHIMDARSRRLAGSVIAPASASGHFGYGNPHLLSTHQGDGIGVWHETDTLAWMFVASPKDTVDGLDGVGRVYVYRLDWGDRAVEATLATTLEPPAEEFQNRWGATGNVWYSSALNLSDDGSTLVVASERMNAMGALYVYTRPDGPGEDWGDVRYADGVKVTPVAIPSHGSSAANAPFTPSSTGRTGAATDCDAYCSRAHSLLIRNVEFGSRQVAISADGRVVAVAASEKNHPFETPGGSFNNAAYLRGSKGEIYVFVAPQGGWNAAPLANVDSDGDPKTLIEAKADATSFDPATHYSPGPLRRITEPDAILVERLWTASGVGGNFFGEGLTVSPDGTLVYGNAQTSNANAWQYGNSWIFQQSSVAGWQALNGGYVTPIGSINHVGVAPGRGAFHFSPDSRSLALSFTQGGGRLAVIRRPAAGWSGLAVNQNTSPEVERRGGTEVARADTYNGSRVVFAHGPTLYLSDGGCTAELTDDERQETVTCVIPIDGAVVVPEGKPDGTFTISAHLTVQLAGRPDTAVRLESKDLEVRIGAAPKLAEARLELANDWRGTPSTADDRPFPSLIERGGKTRLRLQILDEAGLPASPGSVASLVLTTTLGGLTSLVYDGACAGASGQTSCTIPTSALTGENSDELLFELAHKGMAGAATVWATLVGAEGETLTTERVAIDLAGAPTALAIAAPPAALLGYAPAEDTDPRNKTTLAVSASDKGGNRASVPDTVYSAKLTDPDGKTITLTGANRKAEVAWPLREDDAADGDLVLSDGNPQARVTILAAKTAPLALGEYTLELSAGAGANKLTATQKFNVSGGAAAVELSADPTGQVPEGESVTFTAMVTDASGDPVPDGTPVSFSEQSAGSNVALVLLSGSSQLTSGGRASVQLRAVGRGRAYVTATSDDVSDIELVTVVEPPPPPLEQSITDLAIGGFTIWTGAQPTSAAALFAALEGVTRISIWDGIEWIGYGVRNGLLLPGSVDFEITRGDILWLAGD